MLKLSACILSAVLVYTSVIAENKGWNNINPERKEFPVQKVLWRADFSKAKMELRGGAEGTMSIGERNGVKCLKISKTNGKGQIVVTAPPFEVEKNAKLRVYAYCECADGDPELGEAYLRLYGRTEDLSYFKDLDGRGPGGPRMQKMVNSPPGGRIRKLAHRLADDKTGTRITAAIVVSGPPCTSWWSDWGVEDKDESDRAWRDYRRSLEPKDVTFGMIPETEFENRLAAEPEHTAKVAKVGDYSRLFVDGKVVAPVIFRGQTSKGGRITYAGGLHDEKGVRLQSTTVQFGKSEKRQLGIWSKEGFDAKAGADIVRTTMRLAPRSNFILALQLDAYPEWASLHPGEEWLLSDGRKVYGNAVHADFHIQTAPPKGKWTWPSYHSLVWRSQVKACIAELIAELKRQGLSKKIVGVHLAGYHDAQFATRHPDFSASAIAGFVEWQKKCFGKVRWTGAPAYRKTRMLDPSGEEHQIAYLRFIKQGPFHMQEDLARHVKRCFGKDIVVGRYCMGWGAHAFNTALDLDPFILGDAIDYLVAQPSYSHRTPGVSIGMRIPTRSFHEHGKLFVNEFDLRTYGGVHGNEVELRVLGLSQATDFAMWQSIHHKVAGQMIAARMGWWYLDMSGTWFSPPEIVRDIVDVHKAVLPSEADTADGWTADVAIAIDEQGHLMRNSIAYYYSSDETALHDQIRSFASSGIPMEMCIADDLARNPRLGERYKVIFFSGMHYRDEKRLKMLRHLESKGVKCVFLSADNPISHIEFSKIVRNAGGYAPTSFGLQVDMNGRFVSLHALRSGTYDFKLPRKCAVRNMKTGKVEAEGKSFKVRMTAGETRWYSLDRIRN